MTADQVSCERVCCAKLTLCLKDIMAALGHTVFPLSLMFSQLFWSTFQQVLICGPTAL